MVKKSTLRNFFYISAVAIAVLSLCAPVAMAADEAAAAAGGDVSLGAGIRAAGLAIGAALAMLGGALGAGRAQASIGAGGTGALAEKPELFANILVLVAIPETIVVFGFVIAFFLYGSI